MLMHRNSNSNSATSTVACAACKHQRKKCSQECKLARYFPADRNREFRAVHKVFGVSNVTKIVHSVDDEESRQKIVESLIWEAFWRQKDPVLGSYGEYKRVCEELKLCRTLMQSQNQNQLVQLRGQGGTIYRSSTTKPPLPFIGWNGGMSIDGVVSNNNYNNALIYNNLDVGNPVVDIESYGYPQSPKNLKQEREVGPVVIPQHSGFSQQYYLPGQFN